jgi:hypothetical protein
MLILDLLMTKYSSSNQALIHSYLREIELGAQTLMDKVMGVKRASCQTKSDN